MKEILLIPGSFNPFHRGHVEIGLISKQVTNLEPIYLVSMQNADKATLTIEEGLKRGKEIYRYCFDYILDYEPLFVNKVKRYGSNQKIIFAIGADTWNRLWDEKYGVSNTDLTHLFRTYMVKFLVFPRNGLTLAGNRDFVIEHELVRNYSNDISSTKLRNKTV